MDEEAFLTLSTVDRSERAPVAAPSAVFDLIYSCYYLRRMGASGREPLDWATTLERQHPELTEQASQLVGEGLGGALFAMALEFEYTLDEEPRRFLRDLPSLPERLEELIPEKSDGDKGEAPSWSKNPPDRAWAAAASGTLSELWNRLRPSWESWGRQAALEAAQRVSEGLAEHGDVLRALPSRHFAQFEKISASLRDAYNQGRLRIVPLAFAEGGGFHLDGMKSVAIGFGLHGDRIYESLERRVAGAAEGAKALADPTRLMLLSLVTRFDSMPMTVGDLAQQLGVSQPTVSGHLKLLREAGLVRTERQGNRTYPKANAKAIEDSLEALGEILRG